MADQGFAQGAVQEDTNATNAETDTPENVAIQNEGCTEETAHNHKGVLENRIWCLACHQEGHRMQTCGGNSLEVQNEDPWNRLSRIRLDTTTECSSLRKLINMLTVLEVASSDFDRHINSRDALLSVIHDEMRNWNAPLAHKIWFY